MKKQEKKQEQVIPLTRDVLLEIYDMFDETARRMLILKGRIEAMEAQNARITARNSTTEAEKAS